LRVQKVMQNLFKKKCAMKVKHKDGKEELKTRLIAHPLGYSSGTAELVSAWHLEHSN